MKGSLRRQKSLNLNPGNFNTLLEKTDNESKITNCKKLSNPKVYKSEHIGAIIGGLGDSMSQKRLLK